MKIRHRAHPVRHFIIDGFVEPQADWTVPPADDSCWEAVYGNDIEQGKRTTRVLSGWSQEVFKKVNSPEVLENCIWMLGGTRVRQDPHMWGGGLQVTAPGGHLAVHLDGVVHPKMPEWRRSIQLVCFCHPTWEPGWGGTFGLFDPDGKIVEEYEPDPGRLIAFENSDLSYHGVTPVSSTARERVTVTCSLLSERRAEDTRTRALFMPMRRLKK